MNSKYDDLREGKAVEIQPGLFGRLSKDKHLELSDGRRIDVASDADFYPANEQELGFSRKKEKIERDVSNSLGGEFLYQFGQGGVPGALKDWVNYATQTGDDYIQTKKAEKAVSQRISEDSPFTSGAANLASIGTDLFLTRGMSAAKAGPVLVGATAGPRILEEPGQVGFEAALAGVGGKALDLGGKFLSDVAKRRGASREIANEAERVKNSNILGEKAVEEANLAQKQAFLGSKEAAKRENEALLHQHNLELNARQNQMISAKNAYEQAKATRSAETQRLQEEYKLAQKYYDQSLKELPQLQKKAQQEFGEQVTRNAKKIEKSFPKNSKIVTNEIGVDEFIDSQINKSGLAGTREGAQAKRIIKSIFPENELVAGRELSKRYKALEDSIARSTPEVQQTLNAFKEHLGERLPGILENNIAYSKIMPLLRREIDKDVKSIVNNLYKGEKGAEREVADLVRKSEANLNAYFNETTPENFIAKLESGELGQTIRDITLKQADFSDAIDSKTLQRLQKEGLSDLVMQQFNQKYAAFAEELGKKIENRLGRYQVKALEAAKQAENKIGGNLSKTYGTAEPVQAPLPPNPPTMPAPIAPPMEPPLPARPSLRGEPSAPIPQTFNPTPEPVLPPAQGIAQTLGDRLEKPLLKGSASNNLVKLGALKYILGKAGAPIEAAALGGFGALKGLTAPGAETARLSFKQAGIAAIEQMASKYPSYQNGIVQDPRERRSLTAEIEQDPEIPLGQKALYQSKVNRGKPLNERIQ